MSENTNCLKGIRCPKCGQTDKFEIAIRAMAIVTDDGAEVHGDMEWDDDSTCICVECDHHTPLFYFKTNEEE